MHSAAIYALARDHQQRLLFTGGADKVVAAWDNALQQHMGLTIRTTAPIYSLCFVPVEGLLFIGLSDGTLHVVNAANRTELASAHVHSAAVYDMVYDAQHHWVWSAGGDGWLHIWSASDASKIRSIPFDQDKIRQLAIDANGRYLAVAGEKVWIVDTDFANVVHACKGHEGGATAVCWHPSKKALISGGKDGHLRVWSLETGQEIWSFPAHRFAIYRLLFDATSGLLVSASRDGSIKMWHPETLEHRYTIDKSAQHHTHSVNALVVCEEGIYSAGDDRKIIHWTPTI